MRIGRFIVEQLSEGIFEIFKDGSLHKVNAEELTTKDANLSTNKSSQHTGIDPILIQDGKNNILLDTGLGWGLDLKSSYKDTSNLKTNLDIFGLKLEDITHVILSHLHFDHAAGSTYVDRALTTQATMPNARYYVQEREWNYAISQVGVSTNDARSASYEMDELYKLFAEKKLELIAEGLLRSHSRYRNNMDWRAYSRSSNCKN